MLSELLCVMAASHGERVFLLRRSLSPLARQGRLHFRILLIFFSSTLLPRLSAHLLVQLSFTFRSDARTSKGSVPFPILALSSGTGCHFLLAMVKLFRLEQAAIFYWSRSNCVVWNRLPLSVGHGQTVSSGTGCHFLLVTVKLCRLEQAAIFCWSRSNSVVWNMLPFSVGHVHTISSGTGCHFLLAVFTPCRVSRLS